MNEIDKIIKVLNKLQAEIKEGASIKIFADGSGSIISGAFANRAFEWDNIESLKQFLDEEV